MRRLAAFALVTLLVAACGSSTATGSPAATGSLAATGSAAPGASSAGGPATAPGGSSAPVGSAAPAGSPVPLGSASAASCAKLNDAIGTVDLYTQLLSQFDASNWKDLTGPASPVGFTAAKLGAAIATLATFPDANDLSKNLQRVQLLLAIAMKDPAPFGAGSTAGAQLTTTVQKLFVPIGVAMTKLREGLGCPVQ